MNNVYWQVVGYSGDSHWINRQVSYWSGSRTNHVGIRFYNTDEEYPVDIYYDIKQGPQLVRSAIIERMYAPTYKSDPLPCFRAGYKEAKKLAFTYPVGKVIPCYTHYFLGMPETPPPTCTRLTADILEMFGYPVGETFMPGKLIKEFEERYDVCS